MHQLSTVGSQHDRGSLVKIYFFLTVFSRLFFSAVFFRLFFSAVFFCVQGWWHTPCQYPHVAQWSLLIAAQSPSCVIPCGQACQSSEMMRRYSLANERALGTEATNERTGMGRCQLTPGHQRWSLTRLDIRLIESHIEPQMRWIDRRGRWTSWKPTQNESHSSIKWILKDIKFSEWAFYTHDQSQCARRLSTL